MSKGLNNLTIMSALPSDHEFPLPNGETLTVKGRPESKFVGENGMPLQGNQYGETHGVKAEDWDHVIKTYGSMAIFKSEVMFAAKDADEKKSRKKNNKNVRSGLEQIDPSKDTLTKPEEKEEA
jgi:hypothetical protein